LKHTALDRLQVRLNVILLYKQMLSRSPYSIFYRAGANSKHIIWGRNTGNAWWSRPIQDEARHKTVKTRNSALGTLLESENLTCTTLRGHLSNSWALVCSSWDTQKQNVGLLYTVTQKQLLRKL